MATLIMLPFMGIAYIISYTLAPSMFTILLLRFASKMAERHLKMKEVTIHFKPFQEKDR